MKTLVQVQVNLEANATNYCGRLFWYYFVSLWWTRALWLIIAFRTRPVLEEFDRDDFLCNFTKRALTMDSHIYIALTARNTALPMRFRDIDPSIRVGVFVLESCSSPKTPKETPI